VAVRWGARTVVREAGKETATVADEVHSSVTGGNGERLEVRLGTKAIGLTTRDLIPILLLLAGVVGGYLIYLNMQQAMRVLYIRQDLMLTRQYELQNEMVSLFHAQDDRVQAHVDALRRMVSMHDYNMAHDPSQRLPLETEPPPAKPAP
jgi:hypothetical protein